MLVFRIVSHLLLLAAKVQPIVVQPALAHSNYLPSMEMHKLHTKSWCICVNRRRSIYSHQGIDVIGDAGEGVKDVGIEEGYGKI